MKSCDVPDIGRIDSGQPEEQYFSLVIRVSWVGRIWEEGVEKGRKHFCTIPTPRLWLTATMWPKNTVFEIKEALPARSRRHSSQVGLVYKMPMHDNETIAVLFEHSNLKDEDYSSGEHSFIFIISIWKPPRNFHRRRFLNYFLSFRFNFWLQSFLDSILQVILLGAVLACAMADEYKAPTSYEKKYEGYFQYANVPSPHEYEFGYNRGNPAHYTSRYEQGKDGRFRTKVRFYIDLATCRKVLIYFN